MYKSFPLGNTVELTVDQFIKRRSYYLIDVNIFIYFLPFASWKEKKINNCMII